MGWQHTLRMDGQDWVAEYEAQARVNEIESERDEARAAIEAALDMAGGRWDEWGTRAEAVAEILDAARENLAEINRQEARAQKAERERDEARKRANIYGTALSLIPGAVWVEHESGGEAEAVWDGNQPEVAAKAITDAARESGGEGE